MAYRVLEVTLLSAKDLKNVNLIMRMEVYAVATISGDPITRQCTTPDPYGGRNPTWNATLRFAVPPTAEEAKGGCLHILLRAERAFGADRDVGEVIVPLAELLTGGGLGAPNVPQFASYQVRKVHRTETRGLLYLTYRLGPIVEPPPAKPANERPVVGYPAPSSWPAKPPGGHVAGPSPPKPPGHVDVPLSPAKPAGHVVSMPPSPKPYGYATTPSKSEGQVVSMLPPSPKPSTKPSGQLVSMRSSPKPVEHVVSMPPSQKSAGHEMSMPPSRKPTEQVAAVPSSPKPSSSPKPAGQHVAMLPSPKPSVHAVPPSPNSDTRRDPAGGHITMPSSPKPFGGHASMPPSPTPYGRPGMVGERIITRTDIYRGPITYPSTC